MTTFTAERDDGLLTITLARHAGVTDLRLEPMGRTAAERLDTLGRVVDLVQEVAAEEGRQASTDTQEEARGHGGSHGERATV